MKRSKEKKQPDSGLKEKALKAILAVFVAFLIGAFVYFLVIKAGTPGEGKVRIFFLKGEGISSVTREVPKGKGSAPFAARELLKGPTKPEREAGYFSEIPAGVRLRSIAIEGDTAVVDLSSNIGEYGGGTARVEGIVAEIVYTLTDLSGVERVSILVDGKSGVALGGEGYIIDRPLGRRDAQL